MTLFVMWYLIPFKANKNSTKLLRYVHLFFVNIVIFIAIEAVSSLLISSIPNSP